MTEKPPPVSASEAQSAVNQQQSSAGPSAVAPCKQACWIEVQLLDSEDQPVPREPYWMQLPDRAVREGKLNDQGSVRFDGIPCGVCLVRFPRFDTQFNPASQETHASEQTGWLEIVLVDEANQPVPDEAYSVTLPDGSVHQGVLNSKGRTRLSGIPSGDCQVRFASLDRSDIISVIHG